MMVVDASAILEVLVQGDVAHEVRHRIFTPRESLHAPHLLDLEVVQVLRRFAATGDMAVQRADEALAVYADLTITRYRHDRLMPRIWALRHNLTAYDGSYVALAEILDAPLLTRDVRLAQSSGHVATIELI